MRFLRHSVAVAHCALKPEINILKRSEHRGMITVLRVR